tara:strand:- start:526 stop:2247 length:1722 start_codon:yes stop_codon:yes gene_type:complete
MIALRVYGFLSILVFALLFVPFFSHAQIPGVEYPVEELNNCTNWDNCLSYCLSSTPTYNVCIEYLTTTGLLDAAFEAAAGNTTPGTVPQALPVPTITLLGAQNLLGTARATIDVEGADRVRMYIREEGSEQQVTIGQAERVASGGSEWEYFFDTTRYDNGNYTIHAWADLNEFVSVEGVREIVINNAPPIVIEETTDLPNVLREVNQIVGGAAQETQTVTNNAEDSVSSIFNRYRDSVTSDDEPTPQGSVTSSTIRDAESAVRNIVRTLPQTRNSGVNTSDSLNTILARVTELNDEGEANESLKRDLEKVLKEVQDSLIEIDEILKTRLGDVSFLDTDGDGLSDFAETVIYKTNPEVIDTDEDGVSDRDEILNRRSPTQTDDRTIEYEDAETTGPVVEGVFEVNTVEVTETIQTPDGERAGKIQFKGRGLPNSIITLYIYSSPIVVNVETDENGLWTYTLDQELEDGTHNVYVAVVDTTGKIVAKSEAVPFVKQAAAASLDLDAFSNVTAEAKPSLISSGIVGTILLILGGLFLVALLAIGVMRVSKHSHDDEEGGGTPPPAPPQGAPPVNNA